MLKSSALLAAAVAIVVPVSVAHASHDENKITRASLTPVTMDAAGATGEARYEIKSMWSVLDVEAIGLAVGDYSVRIGGVEQAVMTVSAIPGSTSGEVEFRTFSNDPDHLTLDFDVVGMQVEIVDALDVTQLAGLIGIPVEFELCEHDDDDDEKRNLRVRMFPTDLAPFAEGKIKYTSKKSKAELKVEMKFLVPGVYQLWVDDIMVEEFTVSKKETKLHFSTKLDGKKLPLDFDPVGAEFEVRQGDDVFLFALLDRKDLGNRDAEKIELDLTNTGQDADAEGEAEWKRIADATEFEVEVKNLDVGDYDLLVGGAMVGTISVSESDSSGMTKGEIEYKLPLDSHHPPLDFDPRGMLIEVSQGGVVYLSGVFPVNAEGDDDDDDDDS